VASPTADSQPANGSAPTRSPKTGPFQRTGNQQRRCTETALPGRPEARGRSRRAPRRKQKWRRAPVEHPGPVACRSADGHDPHRECESGDLPKGPAVSAVPYTLVVDHPVKGGGRGLGFNVGNLADLAGSRGRSEPARSANHAVGGKRVQGSAIRCSFSSTDRTLSSSVWAGLSTRSSIFTTV